MLGRNFEYEFGTCSIGQKKNFKYLLYLHQFNKEKLYYLIGIKYPKILKKLKI